MFGPSSERKETKESSTLLANRGDFLTTLRLSKNSSNDGPLPLSTNLTLLLYWIDDRADSIAGTRMSSSARPGVYTGDTERGGMQAGDIEGGDLEGGGMSTGQSSTAHPESNSRVEEVRLRVRLLVAELAGGKELANFLP